VEASVGKDEMNDDADFPFEEIESLSEADLQEQKSGDDEEAAKAPAAIAGEVESADEDPWPVDATSEPQDASEPVMEAVAESASVLSSPRRPMLTRAMMAAVVIALLGLNMVFYLQIRGAKQTSSPTPQTDTQHVLQQILSAMRQQPAAATDTLLDEVRAAMNLSRPEDEALFQQIVTAIQSNTQQAQTNHLLTQLLNQLRARQAEATSANPSQAVVLDASAPDAFPTVDAAPPAIKTEAPAPIVGSKTPAIEEQSDIVAPVPAEPTVARSNEAAAEQPVAPQEVNLQPQVTAVPIEPEAPVVPASVAEVVVKPVNTAEAPTPWVTYDPPTPEAEPTDNLSDEVTLQAPAAELPATETESVAIDKDKSAGSTEVALQPKFEDPIKAALSELRAVERKDKTPPAASSTSKHATTIQDAIREAKSVVFLIDASGSLIDSFPMVINHVNQLIDELNSRQRFTVIFFQNDKVIEVTPAGLQRANSARKAWVRQWMDPQQGRVIPAGASNPIRALRKAIGYHPNQICIFSDNITGSRSGEVDQAQLLEVLAKLNADAKVKVYTMQFFYADENHTLRTIAQQHGGIYQFVPPPSTPLTDDDADDVVAMER